MVSFTMFYHTICLITLDEKGIINIIMGVIYIKKKEKFMEMILCGNRMMIYMR